MTAPAGDIAAEVRADATVRDADSSPLTKRDFSDRVDSAIRALIYGVLIFAPAALGGVDGWSESILLLLAFVIALLLTVRWARARHKQNPAQRTRTYAWTYLPPALFMLIA